MIITRQRERRREMKTALNWSASTTIFCISPSGGSSLSIETSDCISNGTTHLQVRNNQQFKVVTNSMLRKIIQMSRVWHRKIFRNVLIFLCSIGEPTCQKTITLEKASTLFNIAALYTQIGAKKDRTQLNELDEAVDCFLKAAGIFQHIIGGFCVIIMQFCLASRGGFSKTMFDRYTTVSANDDWRKLCLPMLNWR